MKTLLIDGDIFIYKITSVNERPIDWGNDLWTLHCDFKECRETLESVLHSYMTALKADNYILAFSDVHNFRYDVSPLYKNNRAGKRKPVCYAALKRHAKEHYNCREFEGLEGDDVLGILATSKDLIKGDKIIVSLDKDMKTIPAHVCNMRTFNVKRITKAEADYNHMLQTLTGDASDGYSGCPKIGIKSAEKLLAKVPKTYPEMWGIVKQTYIKKGLSEREALIQARLARICRCEDYDYENKKVKLWNPPKRRIIKCK